MNPVTGHLSSVLTAELDQAATHSVVISIARQSGPLVNCQPHRRLCRTLQGADFRPSWPAGITPLPFDAEPHAARVHAVLVSSYADGGGSVAAFPHWWPALRDDGEFDRSLVFLAADASCGIVGVAQCWTGGFIKDLAVMKDWRGRGVGSALLTQAFRAFQARGASHVALKVELGNAAAMRFYDRHGMKPVPARPTQGDMVTGGKAMNGGILAPSPPGIRPRCADTPRSPARRPAGCP